MALIGRHCRDLGATVPFLVLVLGMMTTRPARAEIWDDEIPSDVAAALEAELEAVTPEPSEKSTAKLIEPTPIDEEPYAGEVIDPSYGNGMTDQSLNGFGTSTSLGPVGTMSVQGGFGGFGSRFFGSYGSGLLREVSAGIFGNQQQQVYNGGATLKLFEGESCALMTRGLFGVSDDSALGTRDFAFSSDTYLGFRLRSYGGGEHWFKVGGFVDDQDRYGKAGPMFAALFFSNEAFPVTIDAAVGFGYGDDIDLLPSSTNIVDVANRDYQLRVGTFLSPTWQVGMSSMIADWETGEDQRSWGIGAFTNLMMWQRTMLRLDFTAGDEGFRGFAMVSYLFGSTTSQAHACGECRVDGKQWMLSPINRDVALQIRSRNVPLADRLTVRAQVYVPPRQAIPTPNNNDHIVNPGETFELELYVDNTTVVTIPTIAVGQNPTVVGGTPQGISGEVFNNVAPGQTVQTNQSSDINVVVPQTAVNGDQIFVTFDLTIDGTTRRVTAGPIIVGSPATGNMQFVPVR